MKQFVIAVLLTASLQSIAQQIVDFKVKTQANAKERTFMLDLMREEIYRMEPLDIKFVVDYFKVSENYAWFEGTAQMKDRNGRIVDTGEDHLMGCCTVLSLFARVNGEWTIARFMPFCTDVCEIGIANQFPDAPKEIFPPDEILFME